MPEVREHEIHFPGPPAEAQRALNATAAAWGAGWTADADGGELVLPVVAALRRGVVRGRVAIAATENGTRIVLRENESTMAANRGAVAVLAVGALAGGLLVLWPFFPKLLVAAPLSAVLAFLAWFMVVSRLRMSGPEEFLAQVGQEAGES